ncbi:MAG: LOG family protein [Chlamydiota bacterium]
MIDLKPTDQEVVETIHELIDQFGGEINSYEGDLLTQQIQTSLKMILEGHRTDQLKLITRSLKEMRYAYRIFNQNTGAHKISIFGSARTPERHPDYIAAEKFSVALAEKGWMCITGAAGGIMKAGMTGPASDGSFGLSIRLPFETPTNRHIRGDPKLIHFRYFFTRKLMFLSHANAAAVFPGGVGTMDELFEVLTLMQTGKSSIIPVVLVEGEGGVYWHHWEIYVKKNLLGNGWISPEDQNLYYIALSPEDAVSHVEQFYKRYHSSRYVRDDLVIRMLTPITDEQVDSLNEEFSSLVASGSIRQCEALPEEDDLLDLPRLVFHHTRMEFGNVRALIDRINTF